MLTKNELKYIQSLRHKKQRDADRLFIAEGPKLAEEVISSPYVKHVYAVKSWLQKNMNVHAPVTEISEIELSRISNLQTPNEVIVIAQQPETTGEPVLKGRLTIALDGIRDPGNLGTIIRIADWFGIKQVICSNDCADVYNPKVVQSTMGSILRVVCRYTDFELLKVPTEIPVYGALLQGKNVYAVAKALEGLLVIGNESKGIREPMLSRITHAITIPKAGEAESLNAATATAIIVGCLINNL